MDRLKHAGVAELADALDSKSSALAGVSVRPRPPVFTVRKWTEITKYKSAMNVDLIAFVALLFVLVVGFYWKCFSKVFALILH